MDIKFSENLQFGDVGKQENEGGQCTSTPQLTRRPLQQLNLTTISSPLPQASLTPYKYHRCQVIPEEMEDQENINPQTKQQQNKSSQFNIKPRGVSSDETDESSPFAYPLIWESYLASSSSSPSTQSPSNFKSLPAVDDSHCHENIKSHTSDSGKINSVSNSNHDGLPHKGLQNTKGTVHEDHISEKSFDKEGKRTKKFRNKSGSNGESLSNKSQCCQSLSVTPSKSSSITTSSDRSVFLTPSERFSSSKFSDSRGPQTPQHRRINHHHHHHHSMNPFEVGAECLQLPAVSPSLFRQVVSPSQKADNKFRWSIDQLAVLRPANIETSPFNQADVLTDPDYERQAQDAIDKFFTLESVVPSPWTGSNKAVNLLQMVCTPVQPALSHPTPRTNTVWCQTEMTMPPILPEAVEEALKPFCTFTQDQWWQGSSECDEGSNMNNTTLRRKLLFSHDELLNATPMCSPRGADASGSGSPPSSPVAPLPLHKDYESPEGVEDDDDEGLVWCSAAAASVGSLRKDPQLAQHPPPTPPSPIVCLNPPTITQQSSPSYIFGLSPGDQVNGALPLLSPDLSPIESHLSTMTSKQPRLFSSPDVSPIHNQQHSNDSIPESGRSSSMPFLNQILHGHTQSRTQISPSLSPLHLPTDSQCVAPENGIKLQQDLQVSPGTSHHSPQRLYHQQPCSPNKLHTQKIVIPEHQTNKEGISTRTISKIGHPVQFDAVTCSSHNASVETSCSPAICKSFFKVTTTVERKIKHAFQNHVLESNDNFDILENYSNERHQKMDNALDLTQGFTISEYKEPPQQETPGKAPPVTELRTSSSSGHFSSSPIRNASQSPLELDTPNRRFSDSPPLSPILYHSLVLQAQQDHQRSPPKFLQCQMKANHVTQSQSTFMSDDNQGRDCFDEMMEDGRSHIASSTRHHNPVILTNLPPTVTLLRSSSMCDMETDSQPSLEMNANYDSPSQDTGYQTGSLHTTNFSITANSQENNFPSSTVLPQQKEQCNRFVNSPYIYSHNGIAKAFISEHTVAWEKETPE